jgi:[ribosomal protein S18]-alanine N-acetyltransferase
VIEDNIHIGFAKLSDADEISGMSRAEIEAGLNWLYTPHKIRKLIKDASKNVVVVRTENKFVGFGIMTYHKDQANLDLLAVKEKFRRKKIGTKIVLWLEKVAMTAGCFNIFVQVRGINIVAIAFYEKLGFLILDREKGYYQGVEDGVIMAKMLRTIIKV